MLSNPRYMRQRNQRVLAPIREDDKTRLSPLDDDTPPMCVWSVTITTSSRLFSSYSGAFSLVVHHPPYVSARPTPISSTTTRTSDDDKDFKPTPTSTTTTTYDIPHGHFPRSSLVRFYLSLPSTIPRPTYISLHARYAPLCVGRWIIIEVRLKQENTGREFMGKRNGGYVIPQSDRTEGDRGLELEEVVYPVPRGKGSGVLYLWLPEWSLACRRRQDSRGEGEERVKGGEGEVSTVSSSSTLVSPEPGASPGVGKARISSDTERPSPPLSPSPDSAPSPIITNPVQITEDIIQFPPILPTSSSPKYASWGHSSLSLFSATSSPPSISSGSPAPSTHISFWPAPPPRPLPPLLDSLRKIRCRGEWSPSLAQDIAYERRPPDITLHLHGLDVKRAEDWLERFKRSGEGYSAGRWNCAEVVWKGLCAAVGVDETWVGIGGKENMKSRSIQKPIKSELKLPDARSLSFDPLTPDVSVISRWESQPFIRDLASRRPDKLAEGLMGRYAEWKGTRLPADLESMVNRMQAEGYGTPQSVSESGSGGIPDGQ